MNEADSEKTRAVTMEEALELNLFLEAKRKADLLTRMDCEDMLTTKGNDDGEDNHDETRNATRKAR